MDVPLLCQRLVGFETCALSLLASWLLSCGSEHTEAAKILSSTLECEI